jgi:hypothetical protein
MQKSGRRQKDSRRAVATLSGTDLRKSGLQGVRRSLLDEPLDGHDVAPFHLDGQCKARKNRLAIDKNRTSTALSQLTAVLGAGEPQVFSQNFQKRFMRGNRHLGRLTID